MKPIWLATAVVLLASHPAAHAQQASPLAAARTHGADDVWIGTIDNTLDAGFYNEFLTGSIRYDYDHTLGPEDYYTITGGTLTWSASGGTDDCTYSGGPTQIPLGAGTAAGDLLVRADGRYVINTYLLNSPGTVTVTCKSGGSFSFDASQSGITVAPFIAPYFYLSNNGTQMQGSYLFAITTYTWDLTSNPPELEVEVVDYDDWVPEAGADEQTPGKDLLIKTQLLNPDGSPYDRPADSTRFELILSSQEPGIAMNYPLPGLAKDDFDLQFLAAKNAGDAKVDAQGQWLKMGATTAPQATLTSFDWGAFGTLKVTALVDGVEYVGYLKGDKSENEIRIPRRKPDSFIADAWRAGTNGAGGLDDDDSDDTPAGDSHLGDGLTLYEEYRGFMEKGAHFRADPGTKDLFIRDRIGGRSKEGIGLFTAATDLAVHHELEAKEFPPDRVINGNHDRGAHIVDQHGLIMRRGDSPATSMAIGGPGLPRQISGIDMSRVAQYRPIELISLRSGGNTRHVDVLSFMYAHELGHAVNIWHHGEIDDPGATWELKQDANGHIVRDTSLIPVIFENGNNEVVVYREPAYRYVPLWLQQAGGPQSIYVGYRGGLNSGDEQCFMRYNEAAAYATTANVRFIFKDPTELPSDARQQRFCPTPTGTGINDPNRNPQPRFGNAANNATEGPTQRGACLKRVCVNDSLPDH